MSAIGDLLARMFRPHEYYQGMADSIPTPKAPTLQPMEGYTPPEQKSFQPARIDPIATGRPLYPEWDAQQAIDDGLKVATWVYICIHKKALAVASVPWVVQRAGTSGGDTWETDTNHPLNELLAAPNAKQTREEVMYRIAAHLELSGNAIMTKIRALGVPFEIWSHNPARVQPVPDKAEFISGYKFLGRPDRYEEASDVIHFRYPDPGNPYWGLGPLQVMAKTVNADVSAAQWQQNQIVNAAVPSGFLAFKTALSPRQYDHIRERVNEDMIGTANARKVGIIGADAQWLQTQLGAVDLDWLEGRKLSREEICAGFAVPPPVVGIYENATLANIETARLIFWLDSVVPMLATIRGEFNRALTPEFGEGIRVNFDVSNVQALWPLFAQRLEAAEQLMRMGYTANDINARLDLGMEQTLQGAVSWMPSSMVPAGTYDVDPLEDV